MDPAIASRGGGTVFGAQVLMGSGQGCGRVGGWGLVKVSFSVPGESGGRKADQRCMGMA